MRGKQWHRNSDVQRIFCFYVNSHNFAVRRDRCDTLFEPAGQILHPLEWIAKVTSHIPEKGAQLVHYYGAYSNAHRGKRAKLGDSAGATRRRKQEGESESEWIQLRRKAWTALIRLVYETDPLLCPKCKTQMNIVSVINDGAVVDKILNHLQYKFDVLPLSTRPPPPATSPCDSDFPMDPPVWTDGD